MKSIVVIPTYNERENIQDIVRCIRNECLLEPIDIIVVDSASPDGTAWAVAQLQKEDPEVYLLSQKEKLGLGRAYLDGINWAIQRNYDCLITMDADFSHHPRYLPVLLKEAASFDLVIGSRYIHGGKLENWPLARRLLSRFANWYAGTLTSLPFKDLTSGFHCFRIPLLKKILRMPIHTDGYAFLIELKFRALILGATYKETPIIFSDRARGVSKISKRVMFESMLYVLKLLSQRNRIRKICSQMEDLTA